MKIYLSIYLSVKHFGVVIYNVQSTVWNSAQMNKESILVASKERNCFRKLYSMYNILRFVILCFGIDDLEWDQAEQRIESEFSVPLLKIGVRVMLCLLASYPEAAVAQSVFLKPTRELLRSKLMRKFCC